MRAPTCELCGSFRRGPLSEDSCWQRLRFADMDDDGHYPDDSRGSEAWTGLFCSTHAPAAASLVHLGHADALAALRRAES